MPQNTDQRIQIIENLIEQKRLTTLAHTQYLAQNREYAPGENLYMREVHFVMAVEPGEGRTMSELAQKLEVTQGAVSQLAARLEKKGYVVRSKCSEDKRQILATLTKKGEDLYASHTQYDYERFQALSQYYAIFTDEQLQTFALYEQMTRAIFTKISKQNNA